MQSKNKNSADNKQSQFSSGQTKRQRRCKAQDINERNFICGCGKTYLSHPALYTHMKIKHDGIQPEGTVLPTYANGKVKPGPKNQAKIINKVAKEKLKEEDWDEFDSIDDFYIFLSELSLKQSKYYIQPVLCGTIDPIEAFPIQILEEFSLEFELIYNLLKQYNAQELPPKKDKNGKKIRPFPDLIAIFFLRIYQDITTNCYKEIVVLFILLYNTLNSHDCEIQSSSELLQAEKCEKIPIWCSKAMQEFLPSELQKINNKLRKQYGFRIIGSKESKLKNAEFIIQCFMNWVCNLGFSQEQIIMVKTNIEEIDGIGDNFEDKKKEIKNNFNQDSLNLKEAVSVEFNHLEQNYESEIINRVKKNIEKQINSFNFLFYYINKDSLIQTQFSQNSLK